MARATFRSTGALGERGRPDRDRKRRGRRGRLHAGRASLAASTRLTRFRLRTASALVFAVASTVIIATSFPAGIARPASDAAAAALRDGTDLSERLVAGPVVVIGRVTKVAAKVQIEVEQVLRGEVPGPRLRIAFREANLQRDFGEPRFAAVEGERAVFVLEPWLDSAGDQPAADLFQPAIGYRSRIPIPAEGSEALLEALREILAIQDDVDFDESRRRMLDWLSGRNPWLIDVALAQAARYALADRSWVPALLEHVDDASAGRRRLVVEAIGHGFERHRFRRRRPGGRSPDAGLGRDETVRRLRETLVRMARTDPDPEVRRKAVHFLPDAGLPEVRTLLLAISRDDPSLEVRYEAASALRRLAEDDRRLPGAGR